MATAGAKEKPIVELLPDGPAPAVMLRQRMPQLCDTLLGRAGALTPALSAQWTHLVPVLWARPAWLAGQPRRRGHGRPLRAPVHAYASGFSKFKKSPFWGARDIETSQLNPFASRNQHRQLGEAHQRSLAASQRPVRIQQIRAVLKFGRNWTNLP